MDSRGHLCGLIQAAGHNEPVAADDLLTFAERAISDHRLLLVFSARPERCANLLCEYPLANCRMAIEDSDSRRYPLFEGFRKGILRALDLANIEVAVPEPGRYVPRAIYSEAVWERRSQGLRIEIKIEPEGV